MNEDDIDIENLIDDLVEMGALIRQPNLVNGEVIYNVVPEIMQEIMPSFNEIFMQEVEQTMLDLYERGLVKIEYDENLKVMYSLTEEGERVVDEIILSDNSFDV
jgi:DNA-binding MarR family transcriptional regulator